MTNASQARSGLVLAVLSLAAFMASLDVFIVNVAFHAIGADYKGAVTVATLLDLERLRCRARGAAGAGRATV